MEVGIPTRGGTGVMSGRAALPERATRGVVVVHEIFGRQPEIERVVDRFGEAGWAAVMPDLFEAGRARCIARAMRQIGTGEGDFFDRLRDARAWLAERGGFSEDRVAIIGFCMGGGFAMAAGPGWGAASANYGPVPRREALAAGGPLIACYGERDRLMTREPAKLRRLLDATGREGEVHVFEGVGHSFLTDGDHLWNRGAAGALLSLRYDPDVSEAAWRRILDFFDDHLPA